MGARPLSRWRQFTGTVGYLARNLGRLFTGRLQRYGRVAVNFGTPISVRGWLAAQPSGVLKLPRKERLSHMQRLADFAMERVGAVMPVTPVPLAAAALLSFGTSVVTRDQVLERMDELRDRLSDFNAKVVRGELPIGEVLGPGLADVQPQAPGHRATATSWSSCRASGRCSSTTPTRSAT